MRGFSLVELSIVLVILGLLTGGILAGQSLIRASELRAVTSEYQRYVTATQTFRDKYMAIPGDMAIATRFWGDNNSACADGAIANGTPGTCNGNANGTIDYAPAPNATGENFQFWNQLALAGLVEGSFTGISGGGTNRDSIRGINVPASRLNNSAFGTEFHGNVTASPYLYDGNYGNAFIFGSQSANNPPESPTLRPEELWNIDTKMDDGIAPTGKVRPYYRYNYAGYQCTNVSDTYNLTNTSISCNIIFSNSY